MRKKIAFSHDLIMAFLSLPIAMFLRMGNDIFIYDVSFIAFMSCSFSIVAGVSFWIINLYGGIWRYASLNDLMAITKAVTIAILVFLPLMFMHNRLEWIPGSTPMILWFVLATLLGAPRVLYRQFKDRRINNKVLCSATSPKIPVLLVGATDGAEMFIRTIGRNSRAAYQIVGIVGENSGRVGRNIHGVHVLGTIDDVISIYQQLVSDGKTPQRIIVTKDNLKNSSMQKLVTYADTLGVSLSRLPRLTDFQSNFDENAPIRPIAIEDVLGRAQNVLDRVSMESLVKGRRVLVTGAGGTIGGELSRQLADFSPSHLCLLDASGYALYSIDLEISEHFPNLPRNAVIANVRNKDRINRVFEEYTPELVFHAAALKHVPIVEANPSEGVMTNINGTRNIADCCCASGVSAMVLISTDKAVNPTNIMGASKRIAETYCQALDLMKSTKTRFVTVRFGNVLGSTGSVVPLFQRQLANGGPLTVTHPDMKRYFMTVREAVELVLEATVLGQKYEGAAGRVYVLDMGEPVKIVDLARQMIVLAGLQPDEDIKIEFTGPRPGEKLFEEILHDSELPVATDYAGIMLAAPRTIELKALSTQIDKIMAAASAGDIDEIIALIRAYVPEFQPEAGGPIRIVAS